MRPASAKALITNAFALAGRFVIFNPYTQCAALGVLLPLIFIPICHADKPAHFVNKIQRQIEQIVILTHI